MDNDIQNILSKKIDEDLVEDLVTTYRSVHKTYIVGDDEGTLSKSGKFVENVFRILYYMTSKNKLDEIKQGQLNELFDRLEKSDGTKFSEMIRVVIPRVAMTIYTMRSKLGSEHVKPIVPDFIDSKFTVSSCDWIMAELLRICLGRNYSSKIDEIIQRVKSTESPKLTSFEVHLAEKIDQMSIPELIMVILRTKSAQTKSEISKTLANIGRDISSWFDGGNLNNRLIKKGFVKKMGEMKDHEELLELTIKGMIIAEKLIDELKTK